MPRCGRFGNAATPGPRHRLPSAVLTPARPLSYNRAVSTRGKSQLPRGCAWTALALGGLLLLLGFLSLVAIPKLWKRAQEVWTQAPGTLTEVYIREGERRRGGNTGKHSGGTSKTYQVRLKYSYPVEGTVLHGDEPSLTQPADDEKRGQAVDIMATYKPGEAITVYHHPREPGTSRFTEKEPPIEFKKDVLFGLLYTVCGVLLLAIGRAALRPGRAKAKAPTGSEAGAPD